MTVAEAAESAGVDTAVSMGVSAGAATPGAPGEMPCGAKWQDESSCASETAAASPCRDMGEGIHVHCS